MASRYGDASGWGDISPVKRAALRVPISPIPSPRQLRALEELADSPSAGSTAYGNANEPAAATGKHAVVITTGSDELDTLLGGGVETGVVTEIRGSSQAMLHLVCALSVTTQLPEAPAEAPHQVPGRLYGMKLFGGANGKVMVIDTQGDYLDGRSCIYAVCQRFSLDPEAVLDNITYTCTADDDRDTTVPGTLTSGSDGKEEEQSAADEKEEDQDQGQGEGQEQEQEDDEEDSVTNEGHPGFSPPGFLIHYPGQQPAWTCPAPEPEPEPVPGSVSPWPYLLSQNQTSQAQGQRQFLDVSDKFEGVETTKTDPAPWPASLGIAAQKRRQMEDDEAAEAASRRGLDRLLSSSDEGTETAHERHQEPQNNGSGLKEQAEDEQNTEKDEEKTEQHQDPDGGTPLDSSTGAWHMELLQEAAELIVSEAGTHPSYRCLIVMQPHSLFDEWTEKSRDEVLDKLSDHVTVRFIHVRTKARQCNDANATYSFASAGQAAGCAVCFVSSTASGEAAAMVDAPDRGCEVAVRVRRKGSESSQCAKERSAVIYGLSVPTLAFGPEQLHAARCAPAGTVNG